MLFNLSNGLVLMRNDRLDERDWRSDDCYKFLFSSAGISRFQTKKGDISIDIHNFLIINPFEAHKQLNIANEKFLVELSPLLIKDTYSMLGYKSLYDPEFALFPFQQAQVKQWVSFVKEYLKIQAGNAQNDVPLFLEHSMSQLAILLLKFSISSHQLDFPITSSNEIIQKLLAVLKEGYQEDWSLDRTDSTVHLNKYQLSHLFKETTSRQSLEIYSKLAITEAQEEYNRVINSFPI